MDYRYIEGYDNKYIIFKTGKIFSLKNNKFMKSWLDKRGYRNIGLSKNHQRKTYKLHRLIMLHFVPNPDNLPQVDHINRNRDDNRLINLRWVDYSTNQQNTIVRKNNKLGIKNINKNGVGYEYKKMIRGTRHYKWVKTLQEAIDYKTEYELALS